MPETQNNSSQIWELNGIKMGYATTKFDSCASHSTSREDEVVRIHFGLRGDYQFRHHQLQKSFDLIGGHHNMMYSKGFGMTFENKSPEIDTFGIQMPPETFLELAMDSNPSLEAFAAQIEKGLPCILSENWGSLNLEMEKVIQQVKTCRFSGQMQTIFLYAKCLELIVLSAEACHFAAQESIKYIKLKQDKEKLIAARDLIISRLDQPYSLPELAAEIGMNTYKLKRGFKELFGETVFAYITSLRLESALQILRDTQKQISEIAFDFGYASPQHFSQQFKQHFGYTPNSVRKSSESIS